MDFLWVSSSRLQLECHHFGDPIPSNTLLHMASVTSGTHPHIINYWLMSVFTLSPDALLFIVHSGHTHQMSCFNILPHVTASFTSLFTPCLWQGKRRLRSWWLEVAVMVFGLLVQLSLWVWEYWQKRWQLVAFYKMLKASICLSSLTTNSPYRTAYLFSAFQFLMHSSEVPKSRFGKISQSDPVCKSKSFI